MKTVSVHIVTFNSEGDIGACLDALSKQTYPLAQIVIVDNVSEDKTVDVVNEYRQAIELDLVRNEFNIGFAPAHNQAIQMTTSDYVLVLNPDIVLDQHYVERLVACLEEHADVGSCTGKLLSQSNAHLIDSTGLVMRRTRRGFDRGAGEQATDWHASSEVFGVSGAAAMYDRKMIDEVSVDGLCYDESFFAYKEDIDVARHSLYIIGYELLSLGYFGLKEPRVLGAWLAFWRELGGLLHKGKIIMSRRKVKFEEVYRWFG